MQKRYVNLLLEIVGLLLFGALVSTGIVIKFILPPGSGRLDYPGSGGGHAGVLTLLGLGRHDWGDIHFWVSVGFLAMLVLHLGLHWRWLWAIITGGSVGRSRRQKGIVLSGVVGGLLLLMILAPFFFSTKRTPHRVYGQAEAPASVTPQPTPGHKESHGDGEQIRGSMTLEEAAAEAGVEVQQLREALGLAGDVPADQKLGPMRRHYGFPMSKVREAVARLKSAKAGQTTGSIAVQTP